QTPADFAPRVIPVHQQDPRTPAGELHEDRVNNVCLADPTRTENLGQAAWCEERLVKPCDGGIRRGHEGGGWACAVPRRPWWSSCGVISRLASRSKRRLMTVVRRFEVQAVRLGQRVLEQCAQLALA